ncbi:MAG: anti-sigma factor family protein [Sphingomicrobium sp.]
MTEDEKFFAWLDGELTGAEAAETEARVAADRRLAQLAEQHRAMQARLRGAFDPIAQAPVPDRLSEAIRKDDTKVVDLEVARQARGSWPVPQQWAAMAATLAIGVLIGTMTGGQGSAPVEVQGGKLYAASSLNQALETQLASAPAGDVRIGLTFRDQRRAICRSFSESQASGLACRNDGRWQVRGLFAAPEGPAGDYRMAAGMDANLAALVDSTIAGEPFDAAAEKAAKQRGWR